MGCVDKDADTSDVDSMLVKNQVESKSEDIIEVVRPLIVEAFVTDYDVPPSVVSGGGAVSSIDTPISDDMVGVSRSGRERRRRKKEREELVDADLAALDEFNL